MFTFRTYWTKQCKLTTNVRRPAVHSDFIGIIPIFSRKNGLIPIFRFFFADSDFLMALIPIFENLRSVVIHREEKDGEAWRNLHIPRKKKRERKPWELACRNRG